MPGIVALLPVLLQAALILFLAGLCYLLFTLDRTVAIAFVAFVGIALTAYFAVVVLPILFRRSPYRNPLSHAVLAIIQVSATAIYAGVLIIASLGVWFMTTALKLLDTLCNISTLPARHHSLGFLGYVVQKLTASPKPHPIGGHSEWTVRDVKQLSSEASVHRLDQDALIWAPSGISKSQTTSLDRCLQDLPHERCLECVVAWVAETLHLDIDAFNIGPGGERVTFGCVFDSPTICAMFDSTFIARFKDCLLDVLPTRFSSDTKGLHFAYVILVLLYKLARNGATVDVKYRDTFARHLVEIVAAQAPEDLCDRWARLPSICLLDLIRMYEYRFTANGNVVILTPALID